MPAAHPYTGKEQEVIDTALRVQGLRMKAFLDAFGWVYSDIATELATTPGTIQRIIKGRAFLNPGRLALMLDKFRVSPSWWHDGEGPMFTPTENRPGEKERLEQLKIELDKLTEEELKEFGLWLLLRDRD